MNQPAKGLVFSGRDPVAIPWTLLGFILLSACVHAFGFFMFQTIYPASGRLGRPPVQVGLLAPGTPETDAILRWVNSGDPSLTAQPGKAPIPHLMDLPYIPSYSHPHERPTMAAAPEETLPSPDGASGLDLVKMAAPHPAGSPPPPAPATTVLSFSGGLEVDGKLPSFASLHEADPVELQPARYLLGVSDQGEVRYVFVQERSGDKVLDASAGSVLEQVRFRPSRAPLTWGFATFYWGSEVYAHPTPGPQETP